MADRPPAPRLDELREHERRAAREYAPSYDAAYESPFWESERRAFVRRTLDFARAQGIDPAGARALDVGTGTGSTLVHLREAGVPRLAGNDISREMLAIAKRKLPGVELTLGPVEEARYEAASFDIVVGFSVLHHLPDLGAFFHWLAGVLRPGGVFAFSDPNERSVLADTRRARIVWTLLFPVHKPLRLKNRRMLAKRPTMSEPRFYSDIHRDLTREELLGALPSTLEGRVTTRGVVAPTLNAAVVDGAVDRAVLAAAHALDRLLPLEGAELQLFGRRSAGG